MRGIDVWLVALDVGEAEQTDHAERLTADERERAARFLFAADRRRYTVSHGALRAIAARYCGRDPQIVCDRRGKPSLANGEGWTFSLTHAGELAAVAFARGCAVGVDVERIDARRVTAGLVDAALTPDERRLLDGAPSDRRADLFFRLWTAKEAFVKADGVGLGYGLDRVGISLGPGEGLAVAQDGWSIAPLRLPAGYVGAVVTEGPLGSVRCARWDSDR